MNRHIWISLLLMTGNLGMGAEPSAVALPPGVKAVWDLDKAYHETTPTRERICINGLWRWQPAEAKAEQTPTANWGYFKVPGVLARHRRLHAERQPDGLRPSKLEGTPTGATSPRRGMSDRSRFLPVGPAVALRSTSNI